MMRWMMLMLVLAVPARAQAPSEVNGLLGAASLTGAADVRFLGFSLYRAELWQAPRGFSLALTYKRDFTAIELSEASIKEIARMEGASVDAFADLEPPLRACFADVAPGDRITGTALGEDRAQFHFNGTKRCEIAYPRFRDRFFGIWLGPKTRDPRSREKLLGRAQ